MEKPETIAINRFFRIMNLKPDFDYEVDTGYESRIDRVIREIGYEFTTGDDYVELLMTSIAKFKGQGNQANLKGLQRELSGSDKALLNIYEVGIFKVLIETSICKKLRQLAKHFKKYTRLNLVIYFNNYSPATFQLNNPELFLPFFKDNYIIEQYLENVYLLFPEGILCFDRNKNLVTFVSDDNFQVI
jgi:hypothetical protein